MMTERMLIMIVFLSLLIAVNASGQIKLYRKHAGYIDNIFGDVGILKTVNVSQINNCWRFCNKEPYCASYYINTGTSECRLLSGIVQTVIGTKPQEWTYYAVVNSCPISLGYTYNSTANLCFKLTKSIKDDEAEPTCNADGARVIQIKTAQQQTVIADYLTLIGATNSPGIDGYKGNTGWTDATYRDGTSVTAFFWGTSEPTDDKTCIKLDKTNGFSWVGSWCNKSRRYVCEVLM